jgi:predicted phage-related endonuclease
MKKNFKIYKLKDRSPEWLAFREGAKIGCSELRGLLLPDQHVGPVDIYYKKLGMFKRDRADDNEAMFSGREQEDNVAKRWQYWDGKLDAFGNKNYMNNVANNKIIRRCRRMNGVIVRNDFPYLFGNADRIIQKKDGFNLKTGMPLEKEGVLEIKTAENWAVDKWEYDVDPAHYLQGQGYLYLLGLDYLEIALLANGRYFDVFPYERNQDAINNILSTVESFCKNHIEPALPYSVMYKEAEMKGDQIALQEALAAIHEYEPDPGDTSSYEQFVKEKYKNQNISIQGNKKLLIFAIRDKLLAKAKGEIEKMKQENKNKLLRVIDHNQCNVIDFEEHGVVKFNTRKGATLPQIGNNIKWSVSTDEVRKHLSGLLRSRNKFTNQNLK